MISIRKVLELHDRSAHASTLPQCLGDGHLMEHAPIFRRIREGAVAMGYGFTSAEFASYDAFPLSALAAIHEHRAIPCLDNVSVLRRIAQVNDAVTLRPDFLLLKRNFVFHESAHACAHVPLRGSGLDVDHRTLRGERTHALLCFVEESFANTCDLLLATQARTRADELLIEINSYASPQKLFAEGPHRFTPTFQVALFGVAFLSYLHANYLFRELTPAQFRRALALVRGALLPEGYPLDARERRLLERLFQRGHALNPAARIIAAEFYFKAEGFRASLARLTDFDFMTLLEEETGLRDTFAHLCRFATGGARRSHAAGDRDATMAAAS